jgi:hypothetical protein
MPWGGWFRSRQIVRFPTVVIPRSSWYRGSSNHNAPSKRGAMSWGGRVDPGPSTAAHRPGGVGPSDRVVPVVGEARVCVGRVREDEGPVVSGPLMVVTASDDAVRSNRRPLARSTRRPPARAGHRSISDSTQATHRVISEKSVERSTASPLEDCFGPPVFAEWSGQDSVAARPREAQEHTELACPRFQQLVRRPYGTDSQLWSTTDRT